MEKNACHIWLAATVRQEKRDKCESTFTSLAAFVFETFVLSCGQSNFLDNFVYFVSQSSALVSPSILYSHGIPSL